MRANYKAGIRNLVHSVKAINMRTLFKQYQLKIYKEQAIAEALDSNYTYFLQKIHFNALRRYLE